MENKTLNEKELLLNYLKGLAEALEKDQIMVKNFAAHCEGAIALAVVQGNIDLIEERLIKDQVTDIANEEYTRFCDPEELMPPMRKEACGYDQDLRNDPALES